ncbi:hypothetical protein C0995_006379, partial [Termitomyces sp. Mi166
DSETLSQRISVDQLEGDHFNLPTNKYQVTYFPVQTVLSSLPFLQINLEESARCSSPDFDEKNPVHNLVITAEELIRTANSYITSREQDLQESQKVYLATLHE